jgi:hypothetical protein
MSLDWHALAKVKGFSNPTELLRELYVKRNLTLAKASIELGCSTTAVRMALAKFNVAIRQHGGRRIKKHEHDDPDGTAV